jgi:hypothetical protein
VGNTPSLMSRQRDEQEKDTLAKVRSKWCLLGTFTVQLMGRLGHIPASQEVVHAHCKEVLPDTMLMSLLGMSLSSSPLECKM